MKMWLQPSDPCEGKKMVQNEMIMIYLRVCIYIHEALCVADWGVLAQSVISSCFSCCVVGGKAVICCQGNALSVHYFSLSGMKAFQSTQLSVSQFFRRLKHPCLCFDGMSDF